MSSAFSRVPSMAKIVPTPFRVSMPEDQLTEFKTLVKLGKLGPRTHENSQPDQFYGVTWDWLHDMQKQWVNDFDWRTHESHINEFPQFTTTIEDLTIHFLALFSEKEDAVPIMLMHGWPGSFLEFLPMLQLFKKEFSPSNLPYHLIVPSLPGYTFSSGPPMDKTFTTQDTARILDKLMQDLGFGNGYVAQGGDIGSRVGTILAVEHESCKAIHREKFSTSNDAKYKILTRVVNLTIMFRPDNVSDEHLSESEKRGLERNAEFASFGMGYATEHGTRPSTIGHVLSSSPMALLAWCGEKFLTWVDEPLPSKTILEFISLYWLTETFPRAIYPYRENSQRRGVAVANDPRWYIPKPLGFSYFPMEILPTPKSWVETTGNLVYYKEHQKGGHFAALERPEDLKSDLSEFVDKIWK